MKSRFLTLAATTAAVLVAITGCSSAAPVATPKSGAANDSLTGAITVFAAASLTTTFTDLAKKFEAKHPDARVVTSFAGSAELVTQIAAGAPADVFASADRTNMAKLTSASLVDKDPVDFATNVLEIAVPPSNPASISTFADLAKPGVKTVVCAPVVPCGAAAVAVESVTGVTLTPVSEENAVTDVLGKVSSAEADAGLVYVTDVKAAGSAITGIAFAESSKAVNTYPIAVLKAAKNHAVAKAFVDYVTGAAGLAVMKAAGFGAP